MRGEQSLLEWETLLEQQAGSGRAKHFRRLAANFYILKTEKIPTGRVVLGDWLRCSGVGNRVGVLLNVGVAELAG